MWIAVVVTLVFTWSVSGLVCRQRKENCNVDVPTSVIAWDRTIFIPAS